MQRVTASSYAGATPRADSPDGRRCARARRGTRRTARPARLHVAMKLSNTAAVLPPLSLPKNVQLPRPIAMSRLARSVAPLSISRSPSSQKARQRLPLIQRVAHRRAGRTLRQHLLLESPSRYWCSFSISGADSRWRNASLAPRQRQSPGAILHRVQPRDQMQRRSHVLLIRFQRLEQIPARMHPTPDLGQPARGFEKCIVDASRRRPADILDILPETSPGQSRPRVGV